MTEVIEKLKDTDVDTGPTFPIRGTIRSKIDPPRDDEPIVEGTGSSYHIHRIDDIVNTWFRSIGIRILEVVDTTAHEI